MIDVNVSLSRWPFRRLPADEPETLVARLRALGVTEAWVGNFDALLHQDLGAVNARTVAICRRHGDGLLRPFGAIDPMLPDWREEVRRCHEEHGMPGVRLHPDYHGYPLDDPAVTDLLDEAGRRGLIVQIALRMQDERTLHPLLKDLPRVDPARLIPLLARPSQPKIVILNALRTLSGDPLRRLLAAGEVWVDIALLEGLEGLKRLVAQIGPDRLLFGSHAPFFYPEAAHFQLKESALPAEPSEAIRRGNARTILPAT
ncbi:amidohydrolase family protein [Planctomyces sp. SH-PL62]|uniref:amidohydrolase family protein n=1 Tax=Planctomyces sp. SH-PL62 TaxID=1636152 RepID=UPI00078D5C4E|nr:amidohydrolase family protein [Planctomyces sp. SH-PL62]AMV37201.1 Amidohydrolase [Planctomyces sp. SH-PL62]